MSDKKDDIVRKVETRRKAESQVRAAKAKPLAVTKIEISDDHLLG